MDHFKGSNRRSDHFTSTCRSLLAPPESRLLGGCYRFDDSPFFIRSIASSTPVQTFSASVFRVRLLSCAQAMASAPTTCPNCRSPDVRVMGLHDVNGKKTADYICDRCGHKWTVDRPPNDEPLKMPGSRI